MIDNGKFIKCDKCSAKATFLHPRRYCDEHWCIWWSEIGRTPEERNKIYQEAMYENKRVNKPMEELLLETIAKSCIDKAIAKLYSLFKTLKPMWW